MSRLWLIGGAAVLAALLAASLVIALSEEPKPLEEGTPERVVQRFLEAMEGESYELAHGLLSDRLRAECELGLFAADSPPFERGAIEDSRVTLDKTTVLNGTAVVVVRVTRFYAGGPFESSEHSFERRYSLGRDADGLWRITGRPWPWPFFGKCLGPPEVVRPADESAAPPATPTPKPSPIPAQGE
jgi:hypothetical protein